MALVVRVADGETLKSVSDELAPLVKRVAEIDLRRYAGESKQVAKQQIKWVEEALRDVMGVCEELHEASQVGRLWE